MYETLRKAIAATSDFDRRLGLIPTIYRALSEGGISEEQALALDTLARPARQSPPVKPSGLFRRVIPKSPDRLRSRERRRLQAFSGCLPGHLAAIFTIGEVAALTVVARTIQQKNVCDLPIDAIAAKAGVCRRTVQNALRAARRAGLISVEERRVARWRNDTNVVCIISTEWLSWLRIGPRGGGCKNLHRTNNPDLKKATAQPGTPHKGALKSPRRGKTGPPPPRER